MNSSYLRCESVICITSISTKLYTYHVARKVGMELKLVVGSTLPELNPLNILEQLCGVNFNLSSFKKAISIYAIK